MKFKYIIMVHQWMDSEATEYPLLIFDTKEAADNYYTANPAHFRGLTVEEVEYCSE
jgi:hypothetical protein